MRPAPLAGGVDGVTRHLQARQHHRRRDRIERGGDGARLDRGVRAGGHRDLVLAGRVDRDQSHARRGALVDRDPPDVDAFVLERPARGRTEGVTADRTDHRDAARVAQCARRCHRLVPTLAAVVLRERPVDDGLARTRQRRARHHEVDVDRAEHREDRGVAHEVWLAISSRSRPVNRSMNASPSTPSATRALSWSSQPTGHGLWRIPTHVGHGLPARPLAVGLDLDAGRHERHERLVDRGPQRERVVHARAAVRAGALVELDVVRDRVGQEARDRCLGRPRAQVLEGLAGELHVLGHVEPDADRELRLGPAREPAEHGLRRVRVHPRVGLGGGRGVAAARVRAAHQGEARQERRQLGLRGERGRDVRERAGRDQQHLARDVRARSRRSAAAALRSETRLPRRRELRAAEPARPVHRRGTARGPSRAASRRLAPPRRRRARPPRAPRACSRWCARS